MEENKVSLLKSIILCFNPKFYPSVLRQSGWRSVLYLVVLCLIVYGTLGYRLATVGFDIFEEKTSDFYAEALPDFNFDDGKADYPAEAPHVFEKEEKDKVFAVIVDTSGKTEHIDKKYEAGLLITETEIVVKGEKGAEQRRAIPQTEEKIGAKTYFLQEMRKQKPRVVLAQTINHSLAQFVVKLVLVAMVGGVLLLADKGKTTVYPFAYYFNVGCYAVTPFVLSAFARGFQSGSFVTYVSYGASLMLFLALAVSGLTKCRLEDLRELDSAEEEGVPVIEESD
jgi:hypothetical protein